MSSKRYERVSLADLPAIDCSCGTTRRGFADLEDAPASVHLLDLAEEPVAHFHKKTTEIYVVLEGTGHIELDGETVAVAPLTAIMIRPECRHRAVGKMRLLNIPVPRHDPADFFYDEGAVEPGQQAIH